ncbi:MAG: hypothetical protein U0903_02220 [Planctomycetales bacterium]
MRRTCLCGAILIGLSVARVEAQQNPQYESATVSVPAASGDEPKLERVSVKLASKYLEDGAHVWSSERKCISCHTNGSYLQMRPALTDLLGKPSEEIRGFFVGQLEQFEKLEPAKLQESTRPAQVIYLAAGLSEWDAHVTKQLSPETGRALKLMFDLQRPNGTWGALDCWPPFESDAYHLATVAAMTAGTAPGWRDSLKDEALQGKVKALQHYLRTEKPPHDYSRVLLLWASTRMPDLWSGEKQQELVTILRNHQRSDGGWSVRTFAAPDAWGKGNRAARLKGEKDFGNPESDGHMTGLAVLVLRDAGVEAKDSGIEKGVAWLKQNQRNSGRWWTKSLNTDSWHFITYSGTCYPLLALYKCGALDQPRSTR